MLIDSAGDTQTELMTGRVSRHLTNIARNDLHSIATITHQKGVTMGSLRGGSVDHSDEVTCDDETVLAFLLGVLRYEALLDNLHGCWVLGDGCWDIVWR